MEDPTWLVIRFLPNAVVSGLALVAFTLMARSVQEEAAREQAEATRLALAETDLALAQTKLALAQAEVRALHAQINPHFFFNSLNTIRYFIRTDPNTARDLLNKLSEIFQRVLSAGDRVPLRDEISHVEAYLSLEKARLDDRLRVVWTNLAKNSQEQPVPTLILQPLVENAVIHGISPKEEGGTVHIVLTEVGGDLLIQVEDDGVGFDPAHAQEKDENGRATNAIGLRNVDERLRMLYGAAYRLVIDSQPDRGTRVVLRIPLQ
jgi:sensor histidine kinase YesM